MMRPSLDCSAPEHEQVELGAIEEIMAPTCNNILCEAGG